MSPLALLSALGRQARTAPHPTPLEAERKLTPRLKALLLRDAETRGPWGREGRVERTILCVDCGALNVLSAGRCRCCTASLEVSVLVRRVRAGEVICLGCLLIRRASHACPFCGSDEWVGPAEERRAS